MLLYLTVSNARGVVLCELALTPAATFKDIVHKLLQSGSVPAEDTLVSYNAGEYRFHVLVDTGVVYSCLAEHVDGARIPSLVLQDMMDAFREKFGVMGKAATDGSRFQSEFQVVLEKIQKRYADPADVDKVQRLRGELERVRDAAVHNIDLVMDRGEALGTMMEKTTLLSESSQMFSEASNKLKRDLQWQAIKMKLMIAGGTVALVLTVGLTVCWGHCF